MAHEQIEQLHQAIRLTQKLRCSVSQVFQDLSNGFEITQGNEKTVLSEIQKSLISVNAEYSELEKIGATLTPAAYTANSAHVCLDPVIDKTPVYSQLLHSYKWNNKMHEYAAYASAILSQNTLKRSPLPGISAANKRKTSRALPMPYTIPVSFVDSVLGQLDRSYPDMQISWSRPLGTCAVVELTLGRTLKALLVLRGLVIEWVKVKGYQEEFHSEDGKVDIWSTSRYQVFRKVTDHACAATLHFYHPLSSDLSVKSFVLWLQGYSNLFSAPCHKCGKHLQGALPPTWRDLRTREAYHEGCKQ